MLQTVFSNAVVYYAESREDVWCVVRVEDLSCHVELEVAVVVDIFRTDFNLLLTGWADVDILFEDRRQCRIEGLTDVFD